jgi:antitoxin (DNA-binding transcriptional repressor) of toxin-antitoxin stability system
MNPPAKLAAFMALLVAVFGVSYFMGTQSQALLAPAPTHNSEMVAPASTVEGYAVRAVEPTQKPGKDVLVELAVTAPGGQVLSELDEDAGEHLHLIAFRRDLTGYQHVTPQQGEGTSWWGILNLTPGPWHVIIHFQSKALGREIALATDFTTSGEYRLEPLPPAADQVQIKDLTVTRAGELTTSADSGTAITVTDHGQPVTDLQPAHDEMGHSVLIRPADLGYLHMHSDSTGTGPRLDFLGAVSDRGRYRLFVEFYRGGKLYLAPFTVQVTQ